MVSMAAIDHSLLLSLRSVVLYSTSSPTKDAFTLAHIADHLVSSVGFSQSEASSIATKVSHRFSSPQNSQLVVDFFKDCGFDGTHIRKLVTGCPNLLFSDVDKTLIPKIRAFQEVGLSGSDLGLLISQDPNVLTRSVKSHIAPSLDILKSLLGSNGQVVEFLLKTKSRRVLSSCAVIKNLPANVSLLRSYNVPSDKVKWLILGRPLFLLQKTEWVEKVVKGAKEKLGIPGTSKMFLFGISAMSSKSDENVEKWLQVFRSYGWSDTQVSELLRRHPICLCLSEKTVGAKLKYFMEDAGCGRDYLAKHPKLLAYSMEKRVLPRMAVVLALKENQLINRNHGIYTTVCKTESKFVEMFVLPFKDRLPELFEYYKKKTRRTRKRCSLSPS